MFQKETKKAKKCSTWNIPEGREHMRKDFACIVISHGRPECSTVNVLRECGYSGKIYIVVDDEDKTLPDYVERYGADVHVFHKEENFFKCFCAHPSYIHILIMCNYNSNIRTFKVVIADFH